MEKVVAVIGPTASGKTALGEALALRFRGEIISVDAMQVYKGMDLGTAKEINLKVSQHLLDIVEPGARISVGDYQHKAYGVIDDVLARGKQPFLVGGSMLYASSVLEGYVFGGSGVREHVPRYETLVLGIAWDRDELKEKAAKRLQERINAGLLQEIQGLLSGGVSSEWLKSCGLEYRHYTELALGECTAHEAFERTRIAINQYIKRQYTWWRHHGQVHWVTGESEATSLVEAFLN